MRLEGWRVQLKVHEAWTAAVENMKRMNQASTVRPEMPDEVFSLNPDASNNVLRFTVKPVVFNVPERANWGIANLYIVVKGWLHFEAEGDETDTITTSDFGTKIAYFRKKNESLEHIYGAHYDLDTRGKGHPVFHAQHGSQIDIGDNIVSRFGVDVERVDCIGKLCAGIRTPTGQMDLFSVFAQICADHLMGEHPSSEVERAFEQTRKVCDFFYGAAHRFGFLQESRITKCYRTLHWYGPQPVGT